MTCWTCRIHLRAAFYYPYHFEKGLSMKKLIHRGSMQNVPKVLMIFILLISFGSPLLAGITGKVAGSVTDSETGEGLPGVNIVIVGTSMGAQTDLDGEYYITNVAPGEYEIRASMIGYQGIAKSGVYVIVDHTTDLDFALSTTVLEASEVVVTAERKIIVMDRSASELSVSGEDITAVPIVKDMKDYLDLEAGFDDDRLRGGGFDQTALMVDGLSVVDNRSNEPIMMVNLSAIDQINVIKGGFNAEYGNIRSGLINVVTKDGSSDHYNGSIDVQVSLPGLKHGGHSLFNVENYYIKPFMDPLVMWTGTSEGGWTEEQQASYPYFEGWNSVSNRTLSDNNPDNDMDPRQARDLFLWYHRVEGSGDLGQEEGKYGHLPDYNVDVSLSGPVPFMTKRLWDMNFFLSHHTKLELFALPTSRDYFRESNSQLKFVFKPSNKMKVKLEGLYGEINTVTQDPEGAGFNYYLNSATDIFNYYLANSDAYANGGGASLYWPEALSPFDIYRNMLGFSLDYVINPNSFYSLRISNTSIRNRALGPQDMRDTTVQRYFGSQAVDGAPYGFIVDDRYTPSGDNMVFASLGGVARDKTTTSNLNAKFDLTSQLNKRHELKTGFELNYDDMSSDYSTSYDYAPPNNWRAQSRSYPMRLGAYVQDKIEIDGLIANIGLRLDMNSPNTDWYTVDRYNANLSSTKKYTFEDVVPTEAAEGRVKLSPRLGVSHPISERAKLFFNYGHFYSMPSSLDMYEIGYGTFYEGITFLGNPSMDIPRTTAYELGVEYALNNMILLHTSGYYKDVANQSGYVRYVSIDGSVNYQTVENSNYEDIRGFEMRLEKKRGDWLTGWMNFDYVIRTYGYFGRQAYYEDPRSDARYSAQNPLQEKPLARPVARANINFHAPDYFGPRLFGQSIFKGLRISLLLKWKAGGYMTWDPLETYKLSSNVQWKDRFDTDLRLTKDFTLASSRVSLFMDIQNLLGMEYMSMAAFDGGDDYRDYMYSLHLPMYEGQIYQDAGFTAGDDRVGDVKSDGKDYINMPNRSFLMDLNPRSINFGLRVNF